MKVLSLFFGFFLLVSCGASVAVDYDKEVDFSTLKTFQFYNQKDSRVNPFDTKRIETSIDSVLTANTWQRTDYCQFYIDFYKEEIIEDTRSAVGVGAGSGGGGIGVGVGVSIPIGPAMVQERLTIEIYSAYNEGALVWQGALDANIKENATHAQKESHYQKLVAKILKDFPPDSN